MDERHHLTFDTYEVGKLSLDDYLNRVIFYQRREFNREEFRYFMFSQSQELPEMTQFYQLIKALYPIRLATLSNEGKELTVYRIQKFKLDQYVDFFISSCFVHYRKPDVDIFRIALDTAQVEPDEVIYIEDRPLFVEVAASVGMRAIRHIDFATTRAKLAEMEIVVDMPEGEKILTKQVKSGEMRESKSRITKRFPAVTINNKLETSFHLSLW